MEYLDGSPTSIGESQCHDKEAQGLLTTKSSCELKLIKPGD